MSEDKEPSASYHDTHIGVWYEDPDDPEVRKLFHTLMNLLRRMGYTIDVCERIKKQYPSLSKYHRRGHHGDLWVKSQYYGRHIEIDFFQDRVIDNPNGNEYDFNKFRMLPYLLRLRFLLTRRKILAFLATRGIAAEDRDYRNDKDPLAAFNDSWTAGRFRRGPDGWPDETEVRPYDRTDGDGVTVHQGDRRFVLLGGRWCVVRAYGGLSAMWACYSGGRRVSQTHVQSLRSTFPGRGRMVDKRSAERRLEARIDKAVKDRDYLLAARLDGGLRRLRGEPLAGKRIGRREAVMA